MRNHRDITVVNVDGSGSGQYAVYAIEETMRQLPGSRGLLLSAEKPGYIPASISWMPVNPMGYYDYSIFMIYCLHTYIHTDFALIVQDDGWALNGDNWNDEWYGYDYIGAPCHAALIPNPEENKLGEIVLNYEWEGNETAVPLLNGGFSLRSHRFLKAPSYHGIIYQLHSHPLLLNEDIQLNFLLRKKLEKAGILFAPPDVAKYFAMEYLGRNSHVGVNLLDVFGHHSQNRRLRAPRTIHYQTTEREMEELHGEVDVMNVFERYGYEVSYVHSNA